ncbi:MAG: methyltransferase [Methylococcaceae bacterium]|jgi:hypothetical protein
MTPIPEQVGKFRGLINGYKISQIIMSLEKLGVFRALADDVTNIEDIASQVGVSSAKLAPLLNGVVHYGLLSKNGESYGFSDDAVVLNPKHPASQNGYIGFSENVRDKWTKLSELVTEKEVGDLNKVTGGNQEETRNFISAMHVNAIPQSKFIVENFDFTDHRILDLGAGSGVFSIAIGNHFKTSSGVLFDLPGVASITSEYLNKENISERFSVVAGDYHKEIPINKFNDILLFAVIHQESEDNLNNLLTEIRTRLIEGGRVFITSFFLEENKTAPTFPTLFSVEMIVMHEKGKVYTFGEIESSLKKAGFSFERIDSIPGPATLYVAS